jgi:hypothetical protein
VRAATQSIIPTTQISPGPPDELWRLVRQLEALGFNVSMEAAA